MPGVTTTINVYKAFYTQLTSDATLVALLGHTVSDIRIGKANKEAEPMPFRCLTYEITDEVSVGGSEQMTRNILTVNVWTKRSSSEIGPDLVAEILANHARGTLQGFTTYGAGLDWEIMPLRYSNGTKAIYDKDMESWYVRLQFKFNLRMPCKAYL